MIDCLYMVPLLIVALLLALVIVAFILQNTSLIIVHFLLWQFEGSLALLLFLTFVFGIIITLLVAIPLLLKRKHKNVPVPGKIEDLPH